MSTFYILLQASDSSSVSYHLIETLDEAVKVGLFKGHLVEEDAGDKIRDELSRMNVYKNVNWGFVIKKADFKYNNYLMITGEEYNNDSSLFVIKQREVSVVKQSKMSINNHY